MKCSVFQNDEETPGLGEGNQLPIVSFVFDEESQQDQQQRVSNSSKEKCIAKIYTHNVKEDSNEMAFVQILSSLQ